MRLLVMPSRMPFAISAIRKLGAAGHTVFAADTVDFAPGNHSRYAADHFLVPSPRHSTVSFIERVKHLCESQHIDRVLPMYEEVFYLSYHRDELESIDVNVGDFDTLSMLHNKVTYAQFAQSVGVATPETLIARTDAELRDAIGSFDEYLARPAYSRGGFSLLTNTGPRADGLPVEFCHPTESNPWVVQKFASGPPLCSSSVAIDGKIVAHVTYEIPRLFLDSSGEQFVSVDDPRVLEAAETLTAASGITGLISFDWIDTEDGLVAIECNPRGTDGLVLMPNEMFSAPLTGNPADPPAVLEAGHRAQVDLQILRDLLHRRSPVPSTLKDLLTIRDAVVGEFDVVPGLYQFLSRHRFKKLSHLEQRDFLDEITGDWIWDGEPIE